jgi:hypothetical protein
MPMVIIHIVGEDVVVGEVETLPTPTDVTMTVRNPRRRDGKDLPYLDTNISTVVWPFWRINFVEVVPTGEEEDVIGFVRE